MALLQISVFLAACAAIASTFAYQEIEDGLYSNDDSPDPYIDIPDGEGSEVVLFQTDVVVLKRGKKGEKKEPKKFQVQTNGLINSTERELLQGASDPIASDVEDGAVSLLQTDVALQKQRKKAGAQKVQVQTDEPPAKVSAQHGGGAKKVPSKLLLIGKEDSLQDLPAKLRDNVKKTLALNPGMSVKYLSDSECGKYIKLHYDKDLYKIYDTEQFGPYRGDICRVAVLLNEGGFYVDLDLVPEVPFKSLVDENTTFMSVFTGHAGEILNALMAVEPHSLLMNETLARVRQWYSSGSRERIDDKQTVHMGPRTLKLALWSVMQTRCPQLNVRDQEASATLQWQCGPDSFRFYHEEQCYGSGSMKCPRGRMHSKFIGLKYGIVTKSDPKERVAWTRTAECQDWWCGSQ